MPNRPIENNVIILLARHLIFVMNKIKKNSKLDVTRTGEITLFSFEINNLMIFLRSPGIFGTLSSHQSPSEKRMYSNSPVLQGLKACIITFVVGSPRIKFILGKVSIMSFTKHHNL